MNNGNRSACVRAKRIPWLQKDQAVKGRRERIAQADKRSSGAGWQAYKPIRLIHQKDSFRKALPRSLVAWLRRRSHPRGRALACACSPISSTARGKDSVPVDGVNSREQRSSLPCALLAQSRPVTEDLSFYSKAGSVSFPKGFRLSHSFHGPLGGGAAVPGEPFPPPPLGASALLGIRCGRVSVRRSCLGGCCLCPRNGRVMSVFKPGCGSESRTARSLLISFL